MKRYKRLLEKAYELEGLLLLVLKKNTEVTEELQQLIGKKISELTMENLEKPEMTITGASIQSEESRIEITPHKVVNINENIDKRKEPAEKIEVKSDDSPYYNLDDEEDEYPAFRSERPNRNDRQSHKRRKLPVFSLNDRFLFMRELFDGDAAVFNTVLNRIATSADFEQAQDYLIGECGLNPEEQATDQRFLDIIRLYFKA